MPLEMPPPRPAVVLVLQQEAQPPLRIPDSDLMVEVVATLPLKDKIADVTRLLGRRQQSNGVYRTYYPTILELITLVKRNPAKPRGREWNSVRELTMGYDAQTREVMVAYCIDNCTTDPETGAPHPRQKRMTYTAPEQVVVARLNKKLDDLKQYSDRPPDREQ
jgi:hypothetical protein